MARESGRVRSRSVFVAIVAVLMVVILAVAAMAITKTTKATGDNRWKPKHIYIGRGDKVRWTNPTGRTHDVNAWGGGWRLSKVLSPGDSARKTFKKRGTFRFRCVRHSGIVSGKCRGMCGIVHVTRR